MSASSTSRGIVALIGAEKRSKNGNHVPHWQQLLEDRKWYLMQKRTLQDCDCFLVCL
jgi:hypothetical protein